MHTSKFGEVTFIHNGDYSGDVTLVVDLAARCGSKQAEDFVVPNSVLVAFVAQQVRAARIAELENKSSEELLGLN